MTEISARRDGTSRYHTNQEVRKKIDSRLEKIAAIDANPQYSKEEQTKSIRALELEIRDIDYVFYQTIVPGVPVPLHLLRELISDGMSPNIKTELDFIVSAWHGEDY